MRSSCFDLSLATIAYEVRIYARFSMAHEQYIERVLSSLSLQSKDKLRSQLNRLDSILERIEKVPSPEKESLLVHLLLNTEERRGDSEPVHSSL
jgi:hypothetical protein